MVFLNIFSFMVVLGSGNVTTTITAFSDVSVNNVEYYDYEYYYEENKSITIQGINTIDIDMLLNLRNVSVLDNEMSFSENGDSLGYVYHFDMDSFIISLDAYREENYKDFKRFILEEKRLSVDWFYSYISWFGIGSLSNSYEIVPIADDSDNSGYRVISDFAFDIMLTFNDNFSFNSNDEVYEIFDIVSENGFNVGMSFSVLEEISGDYYYEVDSDKNNSYYDFLYDRGNANGLFQGRQEGYRTGYDDAIMSQPSSVLELVTKPFVEMGKFLNISIAPNLTLGMVIAIPIIIAVVGFLIKALIA